MKIYTKTGDRGKTSLFSGERVSKADLRVESYGDVDELNSVLGALAAHLGGEHEEVRQGLLQIQGDLFRIGGWLATLPDSGAFEELPALEEASTLRLETDIDHMERELPDLRGFILPGGHSSASWAHLGRTVCRRTERHVVRLIASEETAGGRDRLERVGTYLNRLSDYLFVLARLLNHREGISDILWEP